MSADSRHLDLDAIEARVREATPGPWTATGDGRIEGAGFVIIQVHGVFDRLANERFLVTALADVFALVAENRRLRAEVRQLRAEVGIPGGYPAAFAGPG